MEIGYALSSEEHVPLDLVQHAKLAEEAGFTFALVSDHFHPWIDRQGQSPFVWSVIGAIAAETTSLRLGTGVTCPTIRIHPAIVAQAAATSAAMMSGRFYLGVGTGENLNEHILGDRWPSADERQEMLREAIEVMRGLWEGELYSFEGDYYVVDNARIYTLPDREIEVAIAAGGSEAAALAGEIGDALVSTAPEKELVEAYARAGGDGPRYGQLTVCWAETEGEARRRAFEWWPNAGLKGPLSGASAAEPLRGGRGDGDGGRRCRRGLLRAGPGRAPRRHRDVRGRRLRSRLRSPGRARSGRVHRLLRARDHLRGERADAA